ncbi:odorant receptor 131-2-like [Antennarius striatus]|uniref:odorant receptor 131-2-like n=1 Tax=Antennarius striatus TaxID=241820 RepID=UPI0035B424C4
MNTTAIPNFPARSPEPFSKVLTKNLLVLLLGVSITCINASFIHVFSKHQIFYLNPRYILFIHLILNDMIHVILTVILFLMSYKSHKISFSICCIIILITLFATENTPLNVACMAIECYIAVCFPLRHSRICTIKKTLMLIGLIWVMSMTVVLPDLFVTLATQPLDFFHSKFVCNRQTAFPNPILVKKRYITHSVFLVIIWFTIFYTYFRILFTARAASKDSKKARNTIILHGFQVLLYMTTYVGPQLQDVVQQHFLVNYFDSMFAFYIIVHILPRSISPIIYGVRDETLRKYLKRNMLCKCSLMKNNS